ncbi:hypothetical protein BG52_11780 [Paenibacillus darwinianus]|nr:hypothetical protein BG52_11780 [Paenibacillus darwinianus]
MLDAADRRIYGIGFKLAVLAPFIESIGRKITSLPLKRLPKGRLARSGFGNIPHDVSGSGITCG